MNRRITCKQATAKLNSNEYYIKRILKKLKRIYSLLKRSDWRVANDK